MHLSSLLINLSYPTFLCKSKLYPIFKASHNCFLFIKPSLIFWSKWMLLSVFSEHVAPLLKLLVEQSLHYSSKLQYFTDSRINGFSHLDISEIGMHFIVNAMISYNCLVGFCFVLFFYFFVFYKMMIHLTIGSNLVVCEPLEFRDFVSFLSIQPSMMNSVSCRN